MNYKDFYSEIYRLTDKVTPLQIDCGGLCDGSCCKGDDNTGMYLFPGESVMYGNSPDWAIIRKCGLKLASYQVEFISCNGSCDRTLRPLACRIFPLFPYIDLSGDLNIIMDPRGKSICPLVRANMISDIDKRFVDMVKYVSKIMIKNSLLYSYLFDLSRFTGQYLSDIKTLTFETKEE